jgi:hypothetical protein
MVLQQRLRVADFANIYCNALGTNSGLVERCA